MMRGLAAVGLIGAALTQVPQCTGMPSVDAQCQVYHHKAEVKITNTGGKAVAHLRSMLITLANGKQFASDLGHYALQPGDTALETVPLTFAAGGHKCTVQVNIT